MLKLILFVIKISIQSYYLGKFLLSHHLPLFWVRDLIISVTETVKLITTIFKGMNLTFKIGQLPTVNMGQDTTEICAICLNKLDVGKKLLCGHIFHESCLLRLIQEFSVDKKCPQCREPIIFNTQLSSAMNQLKIGKSVSRFINKTLSIESSLTAYTINLKKHILSQYKEDPSLLMDQTQDEIQ